MTRFLLVRHAATAVLGKQIAGRMPGVPLTRAGYAEAHRLARRLSDHRIDAIYSSPRERARDTAAILARVVDRPVLTLDELDEIDFGEWTGRRFDDLASNAGWRSYNRVRSCTPIPGGEHVVEVQARIVGAVERLRERHPDQTVLLVSHGDVIRAALSFYLGLALDFILRLEVSPASVSVLEIGEAGPNIRCVNHVAPILQP